MEELSLPLFSIISDSFGQICQSFVCCMYKFGNYYFGDNWISVELPPFLVYHSFYSQWHLRSLFMWYIHTAPNINPSHILSVDSKVWHIPNDLWFQSLEVDKKKHSKIYKVNSVSCWQVTTMKEKNRSGSKFFFFSFCTAFNNGNIFLKMKNSW